MGVFNARNERFLLYCMLALFLLYTAYNLTVYYIYLHTDDFPDELWDASVRTDYLFLVFMVVLSGFYFRSCGAGSKISFDFMLFYYCTVPLSLFYCSYRYKGFFKGTALIIFWITTYLVPYWTWYLVTTWTYWGYESP